MVDEPGREKKKGEGAPKVKAKRRFLLAVAIYYIVLGSAFVAIGASSLGNTSRAGVETALFIIQIIGGGITVIGSIFLLSFKRFGWTIMIWVVLISFFFEAIYAAPGIYRIYQNTKGKNVTAIGTQLQTEVSAVISGILAVISLLTFIYLMLPWVKHRFK